MIGQQNVASFFSMLFRLYVRKMGLLWGDIYENFCGVYRHGGVYWLIALCG
jgi:hypothetical protein